MKSLVTTIILAAGKGSRMLSTCSKWQHKLGGFNLLEHSIAKARAVKSNEIIAVLAPNDSSNVEVISYNIKLAIQKEAKGTADAVLAAKDLVDNKQGVILVLYCDNPLISTDALQKALNTITSGSAKVALIGFNETAPNSYGRLVTKGDSLLDIIETKNNQNATDITLCNSGIVAIDAKVAWDLLSKIDNNNIYNEYYLTSIVAVANKLGHKCTYVIEENSDLAQGVNTKGELAKLEQTFQEQKRKEFLEQGVTLVDPKTVYFSLDTEIGKNVVIHPYNVIGANVVIENDVIIESFSHIQESIIKKGAIIGPFARVRKDSIIGEQVSIGNFVEVQKSTLADNVKIKHLSYIGDSDVGEHSNIGAGVITCNFDGKNKYHTKIGKNSFVGSNVSLIAPINIEDNSFVGAGSVITKNIAEGSLALSRSKQIEIKDWAKKHNK